MSDSQLYKWNQFTCESERRRENGSNTLILEEISQHTRHLFEDIRNQKGDILGKGIESALRCFGNSIRKRFNYLQSNKSLKVGKEVCLFRPPVTKTKTCMLYYLIKNLIERWQKWLTQRYLTRHWESINLSVRLPLTSPICTYNFICSEQNLSFMMIPIPQDKH